MSGGQTLTSFHLFISHLPKGWPFLFLLHVRVVARILGIVTRVTVSVEDVGRAEFVQRGKSDTWGIPETHSAVFMPVNTENSKKYYFDKNVTYSSLTSLKFDLNFVSPNSSQSSGFTSFTLLFLIVFCANTSTAKHPQTATFCQLSQDFLTSVAMLTNSGFSFRTSHKQIQFHTGYPCSSHQRWKLKLLVISLTRK